MVERSPFFVLMHIIIIPPPEGCRVQRLVNLVAIMEDLVDEPTEYILTNSNKLVAVLPLEEKDDQLRFNF